MPRPTLRTKSKKKHFVKLPSGKVAIHYEKEKSNKDKCAICKKELQGTNHGKEFLTKSQRRPKRLFGGFLCSNCLQKIIEEKIIKSVKV